MKKLYLGYIASTLVISFLLVLAVSPAMAQRNLSTTYPDGSPFINFIIHDAGEYFALEKFMGEEDEYNEDVKPFSTWTLGEGELFALSNGVGYWADLLAPSARNNVLLNINVGTYDIDNADAISLYIDSGPASGFTELAGAVITGVVNDDVLAQIRLGYPGNNYTEPLQVLSHNGNLSDMPSTVVHELGHAFGIIASVTEDNPGQKRFSVTPNRWNEHLVDAVGNQAQPGMLITNDPAQTGAFYMAPDDGNPNDAIYAYFQGSNTMEVLRVGGDNISSAILGEDHNPWQTEGVPINGWEGDDPELSHIELRNSMMSHQSYRNYNTYMEAELAILQDIGYTIERRNFFGISYYKDGGTETNTIGFGALGGDGNYLPGTYNATNLAIGMHVYGSDNIIYQASDILSSGFGAAGIRVDGWDNNIIINPGRQVHAHGTYGTALMVAYGQGHIVTQQGQLAAMGPGGVAARFDFGDNSLGNFYEYRGSYIRMDDKGRLAVLLPELEGPLVERFDVSGSVAGRAAAIYISENAYVKEINIMSGAEITGDIISGWNPYDPRVQAPQGDPAQLMTSLTFGYKADAYGNATYTPDDDFEMYYQNDINGADSLRVSLAGGTLHYQGDINVNSFALLNNSIFDIMPGKGSMVEAESIDLADGVLSFNPPAFSYGPFMPDNHVLVEFDGRSYYARPGALSTPAPGAVFTVGPYNYVFYELAPNSGQNVFTLRTTSSFDNALGGQSAVTAPVAVAVQNPTSGILFNRMAGRLGSHGETDKQSRVHALIGQYYRGASQPGYALERSAFVAHNTEPMESGYSFSDTQPVWLSSPQGGGELKQGGSSLWFNAGYGYTSHSGQSGYSLQTPSWAMGYDHWLGDSFFMGIGLIGSLPQYESDNADLDGKNLTVAIYGGTMLPAEVELSAFIAYGHSDSDQKRRVRGAVYNSDPDSDNFNIGFGLGRAFALQGNLRLRPFASYEFIRVHSDAWSEPDGVYALYMDSSHSNLHRVNVGADITYASPHSGAYASARAYYAGLYGDRAGEQQGFFVLDAMRNTFVTLGDAMDRHSLGLGGRLGLALTDSTELSFDYDVLLGENSTSHQGSLNFLLKF